MSNLRTSGFTSANGKTVDTYRLAKGTCVAWCYFLVSAGTVTVYDQYNIGSTTYIGTGQVQLNLTNPVPNGFFTTVVTNANDNGFGATFSNGVRICQAIFYSNNRIAVTGKYSSMNAVLDGSYAVAVYI